MSLFWIILSCLGIALFLVFSLVVFVGAPYVPSQRRYIKRAFTDLYKLSQRDVLVDVGSGDGVVLRIAATYGAKAIGYEINPVLVWISRILARNNKRVKVKLADFWSAKLPANVTVVYVFAVERDTKRLTNRLTSEAKRLSKSINVITYGAGLVGMEPIKQVDAYSLYMVG